MEGPPAEIVRAALAVVCGGEDNVDRSLQERLAEERARNAGKQGRVTSEGAQGRKSIFLMRRRGIVPNLSNIYHIGRRAWEALGY